MFKPVSFYIGLRYTRAKRRNHFISFISLSSILGIALGILTLITVLSVMNGFDREIKKRVFDMVPAITVGNTTNAIGNWQEVEAVVRKSPLITAVAPFVNGQVMITNAGYVRPAMITGILPNEEKTMSALEDKMVAGKLSSLTPNFFGIVLGEDLARNLNAEVGDKITVITPQVSLSPAGVVPRFKRFIVTGIFHAGGGFGFDMALAFVNLSDAQKLFELGSAITGLHVNVKDIYDAPKVSQQLVNLLGPTSLVANWTDTYGVLFHQISMEKTMMFFILMLIIAVAVFNLVSTLVMVVNDKEADIAILRTIGATPRMIMNIFIVQGAIIGIFGTLLGVVGGVALALNVTEAVRWIETLFHVQFLSDTVYWVNYLPSELQWMDVIRISGVSLTLCLIATIYPAWRAARTEPVEALRYE
jgi:lipoprotein-releasing system permease protein